MRSRWAVGVAGSESFGVASCSSPALLSPAETSSSGRSWRRWRRAEGRGRGRACKRFGVCLGGEVHGGSSPRCQSVFNGCLPWIQNASVRAGRSAAPGWAVACVDSCLPFEKWFESTRYTEKGCVNVQEVENKLQQVRATPQKSAKESIAQRATRERMRASFSGSCQPSPGPMRPAARR